jgi:hypothetical protein
MQKNLFFQASLIGLGAVLAACSSSSAAPGSTAGGDSGSGGSTPTIAITAPANNGTLTLSSTKTGDITFTTTDFTLMAPGTCPADVAGQPPCGHVHVLIDGATCNDTASGSPYNVAANASPAVANFGFCTTADGPHTIVLELHNDDHSPFQVNGQTVSATISITTSG